VAPHRYYFRCCGISFDDNRVSYKGATIVLPAPV
jgi:hypothetical protein